MNAAMYPIGFYWYDTLFGKKVLRECLLLQAQSRNTSTHLLHSMAFFDRIITHIINFLTCYSCWHLTEHISLATFDISVLSSAWKETGICSFFSVLFDNSSIFIWFSCFLTTDLESEHFHWCWQLCEDNQFQQLIEIFHKHWRPSNFQQLSIWPGYCSVRGPNSKVYSVKAVFLQGPVPAPMFFHISDPRINFWLG